MKKTLLLAAVAAVMCSCTPKASDPVGLKDVFEGKFVVGTALNASQIMERNAAEDSLIRLHFNAIVPENCMKHAEIHPQEDVWDFDLADKFVEYGEKNNMWITGHCLVWHSQCAPWMFVDENGNDVSPEVLKQRMKDHIATLVGRYKGRIKGWDVVNECIVEDGSYRNSGYYRILGEEFIPWAFECAHEADPDCELYLNDYGMNVPGRRDAYVKLIKLLKDRGCRIDAIGMQSHVGIDYPDFDEYVASMEAFIGAGVNVMVTEWDMSANPTQTQSADVAETQRLRREMWHATPEQRDSILNELRPRLCPYMDGLPDSVATVWNDRVKKMFDIYEAHAEHFTRFTAWGVTDATSWKNGFVCPGGVDYPLLFDRQNNAKGVVNDLIEEFKNKKK